MIQYAIVDIETTGGNASGSRITEIAVLIHDGTKVTERWQTLVNPQKDIPAPIFALTGINNEMVRDAPIFDDIAQKVLGLLSDRIFVAHNVNFDYSFIRHELEQSGFKWTAKKLCTVRAARKIKPGLRSYSLGKLCAALQIPIRDRHRAGGDAEATAILFSRLLEWDADGEMQRMIKKTAPDQRLPPNLSPDDFAKLPEKPGVYYFYNSVQKVIYVGKAVNLKKRVASHFTGHNTSLQRQNFLREIHSISFEVCATELMALLLECTEIKKLWPAYNRALKRFDAKFGLYHYEARNGYRYLGIGKLNKFQSCVQVFHREYEAVGVLRDLAEQFRIDYRFCQFGRPAEGEAPKRYDDADMPPVQEHNRQIEDAVASLAENKPSFAILDKGRSADERSCIWVENGDFYGMGYLPYDQPISEVHEVKDFVTPYRSNQYIRQLVLNYAAKYPQKIKVQTQLSGY